MTVETEQSSIVFTDIADGVACNVPFPVQATSEIKVRYGATDTLAVEGTHYTVALDLPDYLTAQVVPLTGFAVLSGGTISVRREVPYTQPTDLPTLASLASARIEQMFDRAVFMVQQVRDALFYSLKFPTTDTDANIGPLPLAAERASKYLGFDVNGKPIGIGSLLDPATAATDFGAAFVQQVDKPSARTYLEVYSKSETDTIGDAKIPKSLLTTTGDTIYASGTSIPARRGIGTAGQVLAVSGGVPVWKTLVPKITVVNATGDFTPDANAQFAIVEAVGGGGGGGGVAGGGASAANGAGGGGSGSYIRRVLSKADLAAPITVTIGAAGSAGASGANDGGAGGDTTIGAFATAKGGSGGGGSNGVTTVGQSGAGGVAGTGTETRSGQSGGAGQIANSAGASSLSGGGGSSAMGAGGAPRSLFSTAATAGNAATGPGGGGGGAVSNNTASNAAGGAGFAGRAVFTEWLLS